MGLLDGLVGGAAGAEMASVVGGFIEKHGGVQGLVTQFEKNGLGPTIQSWVSSGPNQPISPTQLQAAAGPAVMNELAAKIGMSPQDLAGKLATLLPQAIDALTPKGKV